MANAVVIQSDHKIVAAGSADRFASIALARYNPDGSLDASFDGDGKVLTAVSNQDNFANAIVMSGTNIVVAGAALNGTYEAFIVLRYLGKDGSLDTSFNNGGGYVVTPIGTGGAAATAVAIQPGRLGQPDTIVAAGYSSGTSGNNSDFTLVRYFFDGTRDTTFGSNGIVTTDVGTNTFDFASALLIQNTGTQVNPVYKIVIGGSVNFSNNTDSFVLARYNSNGSLDTAFDGDGMVVTAFGGSAERCQALTFSGTKIVAVGVGAATPGVTQPGDFAVARYTANGTLDSTFDGDGKRLDDVGEAFEGAAKAVAIQPDGKIVVAGSLLVSAPPPMFYPGLIRFNPNGTLDPSFGRGTGKVIGGFQDASIGGMAIGGDGGIALVGSRNVLHFDASGLSDATTGFPVSGEARAVAIQPDGKIVVAGYTSTTSGQDFVVVRFKFNASGFLQPDTTFGSNGVVSTDLGAANDVANAIAIQPDGKIVAAGTSGEDFAAIRLNPNGSTDTSFNGTGKVRQSFQIEGVGKAVAIQSDGKIIVAGRVATFIGMVRFTASGVPDSSFGGNGTGKVLTDIGPQNAGAESLAIQADGKILVAGTGGAAGPDFALLRYKTDGSLDTSYGNSGKVLVDFRGSSSDFGHAVALDATGRTVVAGEAAGVFGVARLEGDIAPSPTATPTPTPTSTPSPGMVANVSTRLPVGTGDNALIEGFIVQGPAGSTKKIIVRAIGPSLAPFGIPDALANPTLEIHDASANNATVATNDDWKTTQVGGLITGDQSAEIASSGVPPSNDFESAIIADLAPGSYTAVVRGAGDTVGTGVVDAYDLSAASPARLANISTRGLIQPGDKLMIAGFIIQNAPVRAVVLAIGPSLSAFGISNALPDTTLQLRDSNGAIVRENDDWQTDQKQELESIGLQPTNDLEAALVDTIPPGQYTAQVRGKPETTGIGVVQVYFLQ
jgi:uncharacterized delta-60 repeat protein